MKRRRFTDETTIGERKPCKFFKLMLSPTSQSTKLRIPEKFARAYRDELCENTTVSLTVPTGETWKVRLIEEDNKLWFYDGWQNFVDCYSIEYGYFLLFKYDGNLRFTVHVFDLSTCEIAYQCGACSTSSSAEKEPCHSNLGQDVETVCKKEVSDNNYEHENEDDDSDFECLGSLSSSPNKCDKEVIDLDSEDDHQDAVSDTEESQSHEKKSNPSTNTVVAREDPSSWLMRAVVAAGIPMPKNPYFVTVIKPYCLNKGLYLNVPLHFAREHMGSYCEKAVKLKTADGKEFEARCVIQSKCYIGKGWIKFARQAGLEVGDACVFELTRPKTLCSKFMLRRSHKLRLLDTNCKPTTIL